MKTIRAESWNELQDHLFSNCWNDRIQRFRSPFAFRGLSDESYKLQTSLTRLGGPYIQLEKHLLRNFKKYAHGNLVEGDTLWHWLSLAQHHGLPTRLLDWTYSPFIALHFATANIDKFHLDGVVWALDYAATHQMLPPIAQKLLRNEGANVFTADLLSQWILSLDDFEKLAIPNTLLFLEAPSMDSRIANQFAFFSIHSNPTMDLDTWLEQYPHLCMKIIIPAKLKWEIRDKLDQANVTERVLFPGLDGLSQWLKRHYSPKTN
jgi:hypothetical protein